jgi:hypothetical protein
MNDFNYYTGREIIPVLPDASAVDRLLRGNENAYLIIKERDLTRLPQLARQRVVISVTNSNTMWHLVQLRGRT